jgi:hypothetical protein
MNFSRLKTIPVDTVDSGIDTGLMDLLEQMGNLPDAFTYTGWLGGI